MSNLQTAIKEGFIQILTDNGIEVCNRTSGKTYRGLVSSGELGAVFTIGDQDLSESCQVVTFIENKPLTGDRIEVVGQLYTVKSINERPNSPLVRIFLEK